MPLRLRLSLHGQKVSACLSHGSRHTCTLLSSLRLCCLSTFGLSCTFFWRERTCVPPPQPRPHSPCLPASHAVLCMGGHVSIEVIHGCTHSDALLHVTSRACRIRITSAHMPCLTLSDAPVFPAQHACRSGSPCPPLTQVPYQAGMGPRRALQSGSNRQAAPAGGSHDLPLFL